LLASGIGFLITAAVLALTVKLAGGNKGPAETTYLAALLIGVAQAFAPLPGVSRSGLTIATALLLGFKKTWAVEFSLLIAVPAILGAAVFGIKDIDKATLSQTFIAQTIVAAIVAGLIGYAAIVWLVRVVKAGRLWYFSVYLVILGLVVILFAIFGGKRLNAQTSFIDHRPVGIVGLQSSANDGRSRGALARCIPPGS